MKFYKGQCNKCGQCCKGISAGKRTSDFISKWKKYIKSKPNYKARSKKANIDGSFLARNWIKISFKEAVKLNPSLTEKDRYYYKCLSLVDNKCSNHKERPGICSGYPNYSGRDEPISLLNKINCGFKMKEMDWIEVSKRLPKEIKEPHKKKLWLSTEKYGEFVGFFANGKFLRDYSCEVLNVTHWMVTPMRPKR